MKLRNIGLQSLVTAILTLTLGGVAIAAPYGEWDGHPHKVNYNFGYTLDNMFIQKVEVKTGELTTNFSQTEATVIYNTGTCGYDSYLVVGMDVELIEDGYSYIKSFQDEPLEGSTGIKATVQFDDIKIYPDTVNLTVDANCVYY